MGIFDTYYDKTNDLDIQLKIDPAMCHYNLGDKVHIPDGLYVGIGGFVAIRQGIFVGCFPPEEIKTKGNDSLKAKMNYIFDSVLYGKWKMDILNVHKRWLEKGMKDEK